MRLIRHTAGAAIAAALVALCAAPASAVAADELTIQGAGTYSPGMGTSPQPQWMDFGGTATVVGSDGLASSYGCAFAGSDLDGDVIEGVGTMSGGCGPINLSLCVFVRVVSTFAVTCVDPHTAPMKAAAGTFVMAFDQSPSSVVTSYKLAGELIYGGAP